MSAQQQDGTAEIDRLILELEAAAPRKEAQRIASAIEAVARKKAQTTH